MEEYKGIKREDSVDVWYWLDTYCKNKDERVLENDPILQDKVKKYYRKRNTKILLFNIGLWGLLVYSIYQYIKGTND